MKNIIVVNGVRQSGVTTKANEIKEKIESLGLGYRVIFREEGMSINFADDFDYMIIERFYDERVLNTLKGVYNVKVINLDESDIVMRMIGEDLSKENIKEYRENKDLIVCENGAIFKTEDSVLKMILSDLYAQRKEYKAKSFEYFEKAREIRKKINLKK